MDPSKARLLEIIKERAVMHGDFTLASGKKSNYYINGKKALLSGEALRRFGEICADMLPPNIDAVGGLEVGAIPLATAAVCALDGATGGEYRVESFYVRKKVKDHGSKDLIEGVVKAGDRVVIVDDVLTTGGSVLQAVEAVEAVGAKVVKVICVVDRLQGAREALAKYAFEPIFTIRDLGIEPMPEESAPLGPGARALMEAADRQTLADINAVAVQGDPR